MKNIWQSFFKSPTSESAPEPREAPKPNKPLSDADYEYLFEQLLEGIAYGWQPGRIQRFFETLGERGEKDAWLDWLQRYELKAMTAPAGNEDLAQCLLRLGEQCQALPPTSTARQVGDRARAIGTNLLSRGTLNEIWEYTGLDAAQTALPPEAAAESLPPIAMEEQPPQRESPVTPLTLSAADWSWEALLGTLQENPDFAVQVARELGLETTNLQSLATAIAEQIETPAAPPPVEDAETAFNRGVERYELEDFAAALRDWEKALELRPNYYQAWNNRGLALKQLGRVEESLICYRRALELEPTYYKAWYNQGIVLEELERFEAAIASYDKALELKPDYEKAWASRGDALKAAGDCPTALSSYDKALELQPELPVTWYQRGLTLTQLGQAKSAIASYDKALELRGDASEIWTARGQASIELKAYEEAIASFDKALQFKPEAWEAWLGRSRAARLSPAPDLLLSSLSAVADSSPSLNQRGEPGELASLEAGLESLYPNTHPEGWGQLHAAIGRLYSRQADSQSEPQELRQKAVGRYHEALTTLTEEAFPELHLQVLQDLIQVQWALEDTARGSKSLQRGVSLLLRLLDDPQQSETQQKCHAAELLRFNQLGVDLAVQSGELTTALELAQKTQLAALAAEREHGLEAIPWRKIQQQLEAPTVAIYWHLSPVALTAFVLDRNRPEPLVLGQPGNEVKQIVLTPALRSRLREGRDNPAQLGQIFLELLEIEESDFSRALPSTSNTLGSLQRARQFQDWLPLWQELLAGGEIELSRWTELLDRLLEILDFQALLAASPPEEPEANRFFLISGNDLHLLPLPALLVRASEAPVAPRCFPSPRAAFRPLGPRPQVLSSLFFVPEGPEGEPLESAIARSAFATSRLIDPRHTPKADAIAAISEGYSILHASEQTLTLLTKSNKYGMEFADGESLGLEQFCTLPLSGCYLLSLPAGWVKTAAMAERLLEGGASYLLHRLWPGDSAANALLTREFYRQLNEGLEPPEALYQSQAWLRTASCEVLAGEYRHRLEAIDNPRAAAELERQAQTLEENAAKMKGGCSPYAHPYYWGGLIVLG